MGDNFHVKHEEIEKSFLVRVPPWHSNTQSGGMTLFVCLPDDLLTGTFARWKTQGESTHCIIMAKNQPSRTSHCFEITEKGLNLQHCGERSELYSKYQNQ